MKPVRSPRVPKQSEVEMDPSASLPVPGTAVAASGSQEDFPSRVRRHVYRVGGFRIPVASSDLVRGPRSRCARKVKDLLRRRAEIPLSTHSDPTVMEPPIRKPPVSRDRPPFRGLLSPSPGFHPGRGRIEPDDDEDLDDD